jgi:hypothetical protein
MKNEHSFGALQESTSYKHLSGLRCEIPPAFLNLCQHFLFSSRSFALTLRIICLSLTSSTPVSKGFKLRNEIYSQVEWCLANFRSILSADYRVSESTSRLNHIFCSVSRGVESNIWPKPSLFPKNIRSSGRGKIGDFPSAQRGMTRCSSDCF